MIDFLWHSQEGVKAYLLLHPASYVHFNNHINAVILSGHRTTQFTRSSSDGAKIALPAERSPSQNEVTSTKNSTWLSQSEQSKDVPEFPVSTTVHI